MSLLIKALEQAAKDRKAGRVEPPDGEPAAATGTDAQVPATPVGTAPAGEPTLEPPPPPRTGPAARGQRPERPAAPAPRAAARPPAPAPAPAERPAAPRRPATSLSELQANDAQQQRAHAATVMQAGGGTASQAIAFLRANPVMMFGAIAVIAGLVFGLYVYMQIANPRMFSRQAAAPPQQTQPPVPPAAPQPAPAAEMAPPGAVPVTVALAPEPVPPGAGVPGATALSGTIGSPASPPAPPASAPPGQVAAAAVVATAPPMDMPRALPAERAPAPRAARGSARDPEVPRSAPARAAPVALGATEPAGRERINVSPSAAQPRLNPQLSQAYTLLQSGSLEEARTAYTRLSQSEPLNVDALLGLAYIASQEHRSDDAMKLYLRILGLNPRHAVAQGALIGLMGRADPSASESRLRQLIAREPSAFLHFVLGNLYADQSQWAQAQQSYFQAHHLEPDNPDYAYNLAVGLDQMRQAKLALNFYRRAEQLASAQGRSNFNLSHARDRIRTLTTQLE